MRELQESRELHKLKQRNMLQRKVVKGKVNEINIRSVMQGQQNI